MNDLEKKIVEKFDKRFPAFTGVGAPFPIFEDNQNRNHIRLFLKLSIQQAFREGRREARKEIRKLVTKVYTAETDEGFHENIDLNKAHNASIDIILTRLSDLEKEI